MAIGSGWALPWVTSTDRAAAAGNGASAARNRAQTRKNFFMPFSKDISPNLVPEAGQF